ncbi:CapA family protein [Streptomyces sp. NPDC089919]|uniref:CapA family protein n=1 Tax=Streptomyces sp. NPDC089919 TaxID=3155188 RepID=UPI0034390ED1
MTNAARTATYRTGALALLLSAALTGCGLLGGSDSGGGSAAGGRSFTVAAAGDILIHPELTDQAARDAKAEGKTGYDFDKIMGGVKPVISKADLAICHMEPVMGNPNGPFETFPRFLIPPQIATTIKHIGYDTCSTASNHTLDHGPEAVFRTLNFLDKAGLKHTGSFRNKKESETPNIMDVKGVKVAQISFAFGFNGIPVPKDKPWIVNETSLAKISAAEKAARKAGAEVVILSIHWGREHHPDPTKPQLQMARQIAEKTGINLVIGHHAHVVQPMEKVDGMWVAYGLGNQLARHDVPSGLTEEGIIGWFEFHENKKARGGWDVQARYVPTFTDIPPDPEVELGNASSEFKPVRDHRLIVPALALKEPEKLLPEQRSRYRLAFERTSGTVENRGAAKDGLRPLEGLPD